MRINFSNVGPLLLLVTLLMAQRSPAQTVLRGIVTDGISKTGIGGADVTLSFSNDKEAQYITKKDGTYAIQDLSRGQSVCVSYSRNGYKPNPRWESIRLDAPEVTENVELYQDTVDSAYWIDWSTGVRFTVENSKKFPAEQTLAYDRAWGAISRTGLSAEAQTEAAHSLVETAPEASQSPRLVEIAHVSDQDVARAKDEIHAAIIGESKLSEHAFIVEKDGSTFLLPSPIAAQIAADELKRDSGQVIYRKAFLSDFSTVWGSQGNRDLKILLVSKGLGSCPGRAGAPVQSTRSPRP